jgi:endonuclease YncB( thermonuclease family)
VPLQIDGMARKPFKAVPLRSSRRSASARPWWRQFSPIMVVLPLAAFTAVFLWDGPPLALGFGIDAPAANEEDREAARFELCGAGSRRNCVIDGDTFWYRGEKVRIADINTPETSAPECAEEAALGAAATGRLHALLNAGPFTVEPTDRDRDQYGRLLRNVTRDGESLGAVLVDEGLAEEWQEYRGSWC